MTSAWSGRLERDLEEIRASRRWRDIRSLDGPGPQFCLPDGRRVVSFASNDYLGLSQHPRVRRAAADAAEQFGASCGSARLIVGGRPLHDQLERDLAEWKGTEAALLFTTGFAANLGVLSTLGGPDVTILSDELNHASIIDGCRLARAHTRVFPHGDLDSVSSLLAQGTGPALVVTDTVFSMDGDVADVAALASLCAEHHALLVLDEAHGVLDSPVGLPGEVIRVGTLSKTLGALGGFVAASQPVVDLLRNRARSFIFTTASTPADTAAALAALRILRSPEGDALRAHLRSLVQRVRRGHASPIVPILFGDEERALKAEAALLDRGLLVPAIRPPTVPAGTARLRVTLSAAHTDEMVTMLVDALDELA